MCNFMRPPELRHLGGEGLVAQVCVDKVGLYLGEAIASSQTRQKCCPGQGQALCLNKAVAGDHGRWAAPTSIVPAISKS